MKNKKGFTLVEIIICIVLIISIGTISIVSITRKENKNLDDITNKIIEATNVYINIEKDDQGNYFSYGINNGAKGVQVSVKTLEESGYISKEMVSTLEKETGQSDGLYVFVSNSIKTSDAPECNNATPLSYTVSWETTNSTLYLCPYSNSEGEENNSLASYIKKYYNNEVTCAFENIKEITEYNYQNHSSFCKEEFGSGVAYLYRGKNNNYVKLGKYINNDGTDTDILWRIVRLEEYNDNDIVVLALSENNTFDGSSGLIKRDGHRYHKSSVDWYFNLYYTRTSKSTGSQKKINGNYVIKYDSNSNLFNIYQNDSLSDIKFSLTSEQFSQENIIVETSSYIYEYQNPIYKYYYNPINSWYSKTDLENKVINFEWNTIDDYVVKSKCGLLKEKDYISANNGYRDTSKTNYLFGEIADNEITIDNNNGMWRESYNNFGTGSISTEYEYRFTIAVDENAKVLSGSGSEADPYIVSFD